MAKVRPLFLLALLLFLTACGTERGKFRLEGRLRNMNQGEFYVYSPDGAIEGMDTIQVREGRFAYEVELRDQGTFVVIFPNFSEQAVFGESGGRVSIKGDASHLKEMTIEGTEENEEMTKLRLELNRLMPPDVPKAVEAFIREHPQSLASIYLLRRYFVLDRQPDYKKAATLVKLLLKQNPDNGTLITLNRQLRGLQGSAARQLPKFTATDVRGQRVTEGDLKSRVNVVTVWASWNYQSTDMQRRLKKKKEKFGSSLSVLSICLDGRPADCRKTVVERDSLKWPTVCDGQLWQTPLLGKFGFGTVPANLIADRQGRVTDRNLTPQQLDERIEQLLKDEKKTAQQEPKKI